MEDKDKHDQEDQQEEKQTPADQQGYDGTTQPPVPPDKPPQ